jgi:carbonic anhydrase/acetyltransferase-like protein (isoleucine patch superfamily)
MIVRENVTVGHVAMLEGTRIPDGVLAAGVPARVKEEPAGSSQRRVETAAREYQAKRLRHLR